MRHSEKLRSRLNSEGERGRSIVAKLVEYRRYSIRTHATRLVLATSLTMSAVPSAGLCQPASSKPKLEEGVTKVNSPRAKSGKRRLSRKRAEARVVELRLALEKSPRDQVILLELSQTLLKLGDYQEALTHLRTVVSISPKFAKARYLTAFTLRRLKRYRDAIEEYEAFLELAEGESRLSGIFGLAKTLDLVGDPKGAIELYQEFLDREKRPSQRRWVKEATESIARLRASEVALIDTDVNEREESLDKENTSQSESNSSPPHNEILAKADQHFANREYDTALSHYQELSPLHCLEYHRNPSHLNQNLCCL